MRIALICLTVAVLCCAGRATEAGNAQEQHPTFASGPRLEDLASVDAVLAAFYDVLSGSAEQERDWDRFYALFAAGGRVTEYVGPNGAQARGMGVHEPQGLASALRSRFREQAFFAREISRESTSVGPVAQVLSHYEVRKGSRAGGARRGAATIQLLNLRGQWKIVSVLWESPVAEAGARP